MQAEILVVGSMNMDLIMYVPRFPTVGETILGTGVRETPGGKGGNQAAAAAKLGANTALIAKVGDDTRGHALKKQLGSLGVSVDHVTVQPECASGTAFVLVEPSGANLIAVTQGANARLTPEDLDRAEDLFAAARVLLIQLEIPTRTVIHAIEKAQRRNTKVVLDPSPAHRLEPKILASVDVLTPNESEARVLVGQDPHEIGLSEASELARALRKLGASNVVLKLGRQGAWICDGSLDMHLPGFEVESLDTTGAGDAFCGGLAVAMSEGAPLAECARFANGAAALSTMKHGAQGSIPSRKEADEFLSRAR
jgi:ribokinase